MIEDTILHSDLTDADGSQTIDIGDPLEVDMYLLGHSLGDGPFVAFSGGTACAVTASIGADADNDAITTTDDVVTGATGFPQPGTNGVLGDPGAYLAAGTQITVTFAANDDVADLVAGTINARVVLVPAT